MKIAILTAQCGITPNIKDPENKFQDIDYFAFVDNKVPGLKTWNQVNALDFTLDNQYRGRRNAKIYKVLPQLFLPDYDYWFWHDVTHEVIVHPHIIINKYLGDSEIGLWKHANRSCIYTEAEILKKLKYDRINLIDSQINFYKSVGYPANNGLYETPVIIRKNTDNVKTLNLRWWEQICKFSSRDQLSLPYIVSKTTLNMKIMPGLANGGLNKNPIMPQVRNKKK